MAAMEDLLTLAPESLDRLMPMHLLAANDGSIARTGPTLQKLRPDTPFVGQRFFDAFELRRPGSHSTLDELRAAEGARLQLQLLSPPETPLTGILTVLPGNGGLLFNLSFGISVIEAVRDYHLTLSDFAPTDLTVEMLYLVEAKSAVMEQSRDLNRRLESARIAAEERAFTDTLTGLRNRRAMDHILTRLTERGAEFSLMQLDLDFFKEVNDSFGHAIGDHVLQHVARILVQQTRSVDTVVRAGGDEFVLIFSRLTDSERIEEIAARLIAAIEVPIQFDGCSCRVSASLGISRSVDYPSAEPTAMLRDADIALYDAKRRGRGCVSLFSEVQRDRAGAIDADKHGPLP